VCGALIGMRDLSELLAHVRGGEIKIEVGDAPPQAGGCQRLRG
jgi:hypothetical protein